MFLSDYLTGQVVTITTLGNDNGKQGTVVGGFVGNFGPQLIVMMDDHADGAKLMPVALSEVNVTLPLDR